MLSQRVLFVSSRDRLRSLGGMSLVHHSEALRQRPQRVRHPSRKGQAQSMQDRSSPRCGVMLSRHQSEADTRILTFHLRGYGNHFIK